MSRPAKSDPRWRTEAAGAVMAGCVDRLIPTDGPPYAPVLVAGEASALLLAALAALELQPHPWMRRAGLDTAGAIPEPWPRPAACAAAILRLPRAKDELDMMLHAAAATVVPGGVIAVHGANDEGIRSVASRMEALLGSAQTLDQRAHCRVIVATRPAVVAGLKPRLSDWRQQTRLTVAGTERGWVSYPGLFAKGSLDAGTALLLSALTDLGPLGSATAETPRVLDFGCGTGIIAAHVQGRYPSSRIEITDVDSLAIQAALENVPTATAHTVAALDDLGPGRFDLIVSNPPIHSGRDEDYTVLARLITQSGTRLTPRGRLVIVVQRRVPVEPWLTVAYAQVAKLAEDTRFTVWHATKPQRAPAAVRPPPRDRSSATPARGR